MSGEADTFRIHVRLNKVEYADLEADLNSYPAGSARSGRVRLLLRLGHAAAHGLIPNAAQSTHFSSAKVVDIASHPRGDHHGTRTAPHAATSGELVAVSVEVADSLDSISDLNPADFRFPASV